jgi:hypothetical protein
MATSIVALYADTHPNSTIGVMPPYTELVDGGYYRAGKVQRWVWNRWNKFGDEVESIRAKLKAKLYVVSNGDGVDDPLHPTTRVVSEHKPTILSLASRVHERFAQMADHYFMVRGTNAHVGIDGCYEEALARDLGAEPDPKTGDSSWWSLYLEVEGVTFDITHHPQTSAHRPWTQHAAAARESAIVAAQYHEMGMKPPDVACRAHNHGLLRDSGMSTKPWTFLMRPWQLTTSYGHRLGVGQYVVPVGGLIFVCKDGRVEPIDCKYTTPREKPWRAKRSG